MLRLGWVDYLNCLPIYYPLERALIKPPFAMQLVKGVPTELNQLFLGGELHVTPLSSIEYARHPEFAYILPGPVIASDGEVGSIFLFSRLPITELEGTRVALTSASATSVALVKILLAFYYHIEPEYQVSCPSLEAMLARAEAALLIGDDALRAREEVLSWREKIYVQDLGEAWKAFTGEKMVFALFTVRANWAETHPERVTALACLLNEAKTWGLEHLPEVSLEAQALSGLSLPVIKRYYTLLRYDWDESCRRSLLLFYDYAYKLGLVKERISSLRIWGEGFVTS
ncbi:menaquinone biosynthetic enzyme MqnA/MqnD family protein [Desulfothermobacter acidiphilus]|uniref:menaquinone biosynthetic enzyme MqnA/MqnD family protein n=1 Tax=Desulfothermobacter acidiphilus TaxID=1938353 RepID=UPI003F8B95D4